MGCMAITRRATTRSLRLGNRLFCVSTDDNHNSYPFGDPLCDSFGGFTMIKAEKLTYDSIVDALLKGSFTALWDRRLRRLYVEDGVLTVKTSPVEKIYVLMEGRNCLKKVAGPERMLQKLPLR